MPVANGSATIEHVETKKSTPSPQAKPKSSSKAALKKESPKKEAKTAQPKAVDTEIPKVEKKTGEMKVKEPKPADYDDGN